MRYQIIYYLELRYCKKAGTEKDSDPKGLSGPYQKASLIISGI